MRPDPYASPWRELIGALVLVLTLVLSHFFPWGFAPPVQAAAQPAQQPTTTESQVQPHVDTPRAKGARDGLQTLQLDIDTRTPRRGGAGLL